MTTTALLPSAPQLKVSSKFRIACYFFSFIIIATFLYETTFIATFLQTYPTSAQCIDLSFYRYLLSYLVVTSFFLGATLVYISWSRIIFMNNDDAAKPFLAIIVFFWLAWNFGTSITYLVKYHKKQLWPIKSSSKSKAVSDPVSGSIDTSMPPSDSTIIYSSSSTPTVISSIDPTSSLSPYPSSTSIPPTSTYLPSMMTSTFTPLSTTIATSMPSLDDSDNMCHIEENMKEADNLYKASISTIVITSTCFTILFIIVLADKGVISLPSVKKVSP